MFLILGDEDWKQSESRYKLVRLKVFMFMNNSRPGKAIDVTVALLSLFSSLAFIILSYYDLRYLNPCCDEALKKFAEFIVSTDE